MKLTELFTKISYVFKTDIYVLQHKYIVGGSDSNLKNTGTMICILNEETSELMKREVSEKDFFYIKNIKEAKTDLEDNLVLDILPTTKSGVEENLKSLIKEKNKVKNWGSITLTEDEYDDFFNKNISINICKDETLTPIVVCKNMFPMLTEKNFENLKYYLKINGEFTDNLLTKFDTDYFELYNFLYYLNY